MELGFFHRQRRAARRVGGPLQTIIYYSPSGAAARILLSSVFYTSPPIDTVATMIVYTAIFTFVAIRYF